MEKSNEELLAEVAARLRDLQRRTDDMRKPDTALIAIADCELRAYIAGVVSGILGLDWGIVMVDSPPEAINALTGEIADQIKIVIIDEELHSFSMGSVAATIGSEGIPHVAYVGQTDVGRFRGVITHNNVAFNIGSRNFLKDLINWLNEISTKPTTGS